MGDFIISKYPGARLCHESYGPDAWGPLNPFRQTESPIGSLIPPLLEQGHIEDEVPRTMLLSENLRRVGAHQPGWKESDLFLKPGLTDHLHCLVWYVFNSSWTNHLSQPPAFWRRLQKSSQAGDSVLLLKSCSVSSCFHVRTQMKDTTLWCCFLMLFVAKRPVDG